MERSEERAKSKYPETNMALNTVNSANHTRYDREISIFSNNLLHVL